jgi:hypothetical protein
VLEFAMNRDTREEIAEQAKLRAEAKYGGRVDTRKTGGGIGAEYILAGIFIFGMIAGIFILKEFNRQAYGHIQVPESNFSVPR